MGAVTVTPGETLGTLVYTFGVGSNKTMIVPNKSLSLSLSKQHRSSQVACIHIHGMSMHYASLIMIYDIYTCIHIRTFMYSYIHIHIYTYLHTHTHTERERERKLSSDLPPASMRIHATPTFGRHGVLNSQIPNPKP